MDFEKTLEVLGALEREGVQYVIFGGVALNLQGLARATQDLDLFIAPNAENVGLLRAALASVFSDPSISEITSEALLGDYPAIQYVPPDEGFHIDILTRLGDAFRFEDLETERVSLGDIEVTVVTAQMLYRMKKNTVRPSRPW